MPDLCKQQGAWIQEAANTGNSLSFLISEFARIQLNGADFGVIIGALYAEVNDGRTSIESKVASSGRCWDHDDSVGAHVSNAQTAQLQAQSGYKWTASRYPGALPELQGVHVPKDGQAAPRTVALSFTGIADWSDMKIQGTCSSCAVGRVRERVDKPTSNREASKH